MFYQMLQLYILFILFPKRVNRSKLVDIADGRTIIP